jgi:hypothetical protein
MAYYKEIQTSPQCIVFRYATGGHSAAKLLTGAATIPFGLWMRTWNAQSPRTNWIPFADKSFLDVPEVLIIAGIGLCLFALKLIWTYQHIELDKGGSLLTHVIRCPWKRSVQRFPFSDIIRFVMTEEISRDADDREKTSYRVVMIMKDDSEVELGHGDEGEWKRLADRLAELTGAKSLSEVKGR